MLLSPKQIGTICFIFSILIFPSYATVNIQPGDATADCDSATLTTSENDVTANLTAQYHANTITFTYDANGGVDSTSGETWSNDSGVSSCEYDGTFNLPTPPSKTGYNFDGWRWICELGSVDYSENSEWDSTHARWKPIGSGADRVTMESEFGVENSDGLGSGQWVVSFSYGEVHGNVNCTSSSSSWGYNPYNSGRFCWCAVTKYTPKNGVCPAFSGVHIYSGLNGGNPAGCQNRCARQCAYKIQSDAAFRQRMFVQSN